MLKIEYCSYLHRLWMVKRENVERMISNHLLTLILVSVDLEKFIRLGIRYLKTCLQLKSLTKRKFWNMTWLSRLNLKLRLCISFIRTISLNCIIIMKMMTTFILFSNFVPKDKSIRFSKKKVGSTKKLLLNTWGNAYLQYNIFTHWIHQLSIGTLSRKIFSLIPMELLSLLILDGVIITRMRIDGLPIVVLQSI